jgi:hypothetical protein
VYAFGGDGRKNKTNLDSALDTVEMYSTATGGDEWVVLNVTLNKPAAEIACVVIDQFPLFRIPTGSYWTMHFVLSLMCIVVVAVCVTIV